MRYRAKVMRSTFMEGKFMIRIRKILLALIVVGTCSTLLADLAPTKGKFLDYFFVDRWGQGIFGSFYVDPDLHKALKRDTWCPIKIEAIRISQPMNPGGAMIRRLKSARALPPAKLQIKLESDSHRVTYNHKAVLTVSVTNGWDKPIGLYRRDLLLAITVHKRGTTPQGKPKHDEIFDCFNNPYHDFAGKTQLLRATMYEKLFTDKGDIRMKEGNPELIIQKESESKRAGLYDEDKRTLEPGASAIFRYTIGTGWYINEYELQVRYRPRENIGVEFVVSEPMSFDVISPERIGQPGARLLPKNVKISI
jgi:hypothetical protein